MTQQLMNMEQMVSRASVDPAFKQKLFNNPKAVLAKEAGVNIPENVELTVLEESANTFYLIIPKEADSTAFLEQETKDPILTLIAQASQDETLKQELLNSPKTVIQRETGITIPEDTQVQILEQTDTKDYMVLSALTATEDEELSDEELEAVAGGGVWDVVKKTATYVGKSFWHGFKNMCK
ncbi:MAG: NHLP leader peptide family natural product precursor [Coleofasciculus sp. Co-bin14]|nr:NHLP leader peptide family natural product precursor [Coleofasciculus sp. Co-bin14]